MLIPLRRFPWVSLLLLFAAYTIAGKYLASTATYSATWVPVAIAAAFGFVLAWLMMNPLTGMQRFLRRWFQSDAVAFTALVGMAAFASIFLNWFKIFMPFFMVLSAESLARIDLQTAEYSQRQAFALLTFVAWLGLALGWIISHVI